VQKCNVQDALIGESSKVLKLVAADCRYYCCYSTCARNRREVLSLHANFKRHGTVGTAMKVRFVYLTS
jgi:hypothetical protein